MTYYAIVEFKVRVQLKVDDININQSDLSIKDESIVLDEAYYQVGANPFTDHCDQDTGEIIEVWEHKNDESWELKNGIKKNTEEH